MTRHWKKILAWSVAAVALFAALGFLAVPPIARGQLEKLLSAELGRPVRVGRVEFNPFTLKAAVEDFSIGGRAEGAAPLAAFRRLEVDAGWRSVIERAPVIQRVTLSGPRVRLAREAEGRYDVDDLIEKWLARPKDPDAPTPRFSVANIVLEDGRIDLDDRVLPRVHEVTGLEIRVPFVSSLPVHQEIDVEPKLAAKVGGASIDIEGRSRPFTATHESAIDFTVAPLDLAPYAGYLPAGLPAKLVSGVVSADLRVEFAQPAAGAPAVTVSGQAGAAGLGLQDPSGAPLLSADSLKAEDLKLEPFSNAYAIGRVLVEGPAVTVHRHRDQARFLEPVMAALDAQARGRTAPSPAAAPAGATRWSIGEIGVSGGRVDFLDEQFSPRRLAVKLAELKARVTGLRSDAAEPVPYELAFAADTGERIEADGRLALRPLSVEGKLSAAGVALKNWWWIAEPHLQADLLDGRLALQGGYRFDPAAGPSALGLTGLAAQLESLKLAQRWDRRELLRVDSLKLAEISVDLGARRIEVGSVEGDGGRAALSRDRDGVLNLARLLAPPGAARGGAPARAGAAAPANAVAPVPAPARAGAAASARRDADWSVKLGRLAMQRWAASLTDAAAGRDGDLQLSALALTAEGFDTSNKEPGRVSLKTKVGKAGSLGASGRLGLAPLSGRLRIDANRVGLLPAQPWFTSAVNAVVTSGELSARGDLGFDVPERGPVRASWRGQATVSDFAAVTKAANEDLLRWKRLHAAGVDFVLEPLKVDVGEVLLAGFYSRLVLSPEGRLNLQDVLVRDEAAAKAAAAPAAPVAGAPAAAAGPPLPVRIGRILLEDGAVYFTDNFIRPNYSASLTSLAGSVGTLTPETAGDVELRGRVAGTGSLEIVGSLNPLAPSLFLDLKATARDIDLPPTTPYSVKYLGYGIEKGKLSAKVRYTLRDRRLEAENNVVLDQLTFGEKVDSPTATKLPVLFAISLLKDRNGVIDVDMPIGGSLDDPQFSIAGLVVRMIFNLIGKVVTAPFTLLAKLGGASADLSQVAFAAGSAKLDAGALERLQALAKALADRPALRLDLAGRVDPVADREALRRAAMQRLVKAEKSREMVRAGDPAPALDEIQLGPDEYQRHLRAAYRRGSFEKPRNAIGLVKDVPVEEMERLLLASVTLGDDSLRALADERARAAREWLVGHGVDAGRLFVVAPKLGGDAPEANRSLSAVDLSLK